jgi:ADP-heptose:LPS heptosyltransferase
MSWKGVPIEGVVWLAGILEKLQSTPPLGTPKDIIVFRPSDLGDLLTTTPLFEALGNHFPTSRIIAGVGSWGRPIVENNPFIHEIVELDAPWNNKAIPRQGLPDIARFLFSSRQVSLLRKRNGFDVGIDILGSHVGSLLMMRLGVRHRIGVRGYRGGWSACEKYIYFKKDVHVARAALAQAELLGVTDLPEARPQIYLTSAERNEAERIWAKSTLAGSKKLLVACGGGFDSKCWPPESFGEALRLFSNDALVSGSEPLNIVLVGGPADRERVAKVMASCIPGARSVCGETSLRITFALAEQADLVLTNASMMLHAAAAFSRPTIVVLGGIHPNLEEHDRLWGYPPPYQSVGTKGSEVWPSVTRVVEAIRATLLLPTTH